MQREAIELTTKGVTDQELQRVRNKRRTTLAAEAEALVPDARVFVQRIRRNGGGQNMGQAEAQILHRPARPFDLLNSLALANTAFADFPRLGALHAGDGFLPRQLTYRGSRLVYSRGIVTLAVIWGRSFSSGLGTSRMTG